jgi:hypothetical protein
MTAFSNREAWLLAAVQMLKPIFAAKRHLVPDDCQVSCGFASTGTRSHHIGQCWSRRSSTNERNQIFISPALGDPVHVLDTLVHELVHAVDNCEHKHGKEFKKIAEIDKLLLGKLSDALNETQKLNKINNLLTKWRRSGRIVNTGSDKASRWVSAEKLAEKK